MSRRRGRVKGTTQGQCMKGCMHGWCDVSRMRDNVGGGVCDEGWVEGPHDTRKVRMGRAREARGTPCGQEGVWGEREGDKTHDETGGSSSWRRIGLRSDQRHRVERGGEGGDARVCHARIGALCPHTRACRRRACCDDRERRIMEPVMVRSGGGVG